MLIVWILWQIPECVFLTDLQSRPPTTRDTFMGESSQQVGEKNIGLAEENTNNQHLDSSPIRHEVYKYNI